MEDFDTLLWQLAHNNIQAYKDEGTWFLLVYTRCNYLQNDGRCRIYSTRPQLCRDYSNDYCEYDAPAEDGFELFFDGYESLLAYCRKRFKHWDTRFKQPAISA
jgi:Fe-S-cluster containining protein